MLQTNVIRSLLAACWLLSVSKTLTALDAHRTLDQFSYQTWQTGSGLPQNTIHGILQSRDGYLWLASDGGLVRFDGYTFTTFDTRKAPELKSDFVQSLAEDRTGALWIATAGGLCRYVAGRFETVPVDGGIASVSGVLSLHGDRIGGVWGVTSDALIHWPADRRQSVRGNGDHANNEAPLIFKAPHEMARLTGALAQADDGTTWVGTQAGVSMLRNGALTNTFRNFPQGAVQALLLDRSGRLWIAASHGLYVSTAPRSEVISQARPNSAGSSALSLFEDWEHNIWVGGENGLERLSAPSQSVDKPDRAVPGVSVIAMAEDAEGDLWLGTESAGLTAIRNQKFVVYGAREGLAGDSVRSLFERAPGVVAIGTNSGLTEYDGKHFEHWSTRNGLSSDVILSLGKDRAGSLAIGTPDGLDLLNLHGQISALTSADGLADDFIRSVYCDRDGSLWIGTRRGLSHSEPNGTYTSYTQANGLGSDLVGSVLRDGRGDLWVGTLNGLSKFQGDKFRTFRKEQGLSSNIVTTLRRDESGGLWIGTADAGLNFLSDGVIHSLPKSLGLPDAVLGIGEDPNGEFWLASKVGIARVSRSELRDVALGQRRAATVVWYGTSDGLRISECSSGGHPTVLEQGNGTLWFATRKGAAVLYPSAAQLNRVPPPVMIESVRADDKPVPITDQIQVPAGYSRLAFQYAGISLAAPQKVVYRYKLDGFDKNWIEAGTQRLANYTNLPPGGYRFRVVARNNDGFWNESGALVTLTLEPRFYQTLWFYAVLALALAGAGYGVYRWRVAEVEARFGAVLQERNRIAREIHDTLAQSFVGVSMQLEIVARLLSSSAESAREHLDQARLQVRGAIAEARRSIWQLRSQSSDSDDLPSRLSASVGQMVGSNQLVKFTLEVRGTYRPLRPEVEDELLRIGQEAARNALRHAAPQWIAVELDYLARKLRMTITDDGCGFDSRAKSAHHNGHYGLQGMRERAEQIKADFAVESAAGQGTKVSVEAMLNS